MNQPSEEARKAVDILGQWVMSVISEWNRLRKRAYDIGLPASYTIEFSKPYEMQLGEDELKISFGGTTCHLTQLVSQPGFDLKSLPKIRQVVTDALKQQQKNIDDKIAAQEKEKRDHIASMSKILPGVIDDFGADIMQFRGVTQQAPKPAEPPKERKSIFTLSKLFRDKL